MSAGVLVAVVAAALATGLAVPPVVRAPSPRRPPTASATDDGWLRRHRVLWSVLAGAAGATFVSGTPGIVAGVAIAVGVWVVVGRAEPLAVRRQREEVRRDLPAVVALLASGLRSGSAPLDAVVLVSRALPGAAADRLGPVVARLRLGVDPAAVWGDVADDLARRARAEVEDRARAVGVKAAVPLGLCLLPSFVLIGIVPLVAALLESIVW